MDGFRHVIPINVRFRDLDALGHVNNATFITYAETARYHYLVESGLIDQSISSWQNFGFILAHIQCDFKQPITIGQQVRVGSRIEEMGRSSFRLAYRIEADGMLAATGYAIMVYFDYQAACSLPISERMKAKIEAFEETQLS